MSIGLMTALKVIPWGDVITAAPAILKGARGLFSRSPTPHAESAEAGGTPLPAEARIAELESELKELMGAHRQLAELTAKLADQNAKVVQAIDILRLRTRWLLAFSGVLGIGLLAALALSYSLFGAG